MLTVELFRDEKLNLEKTVEKSREIDEERCCEVTGNRS